MRDRRKQRENRRHKEEPISRRNAGGFDDPTPQQAVDLMILKERKSIKASTKIGVA